MRGVGGEEFPTILLILPQKFLFRIRTRCRFTDFVHRFGIVGDDVRSPFEVKGLPMNEVPMDCAGRAERRRRFGGRGRFQSGVDAPLCHRSP